MNCVVIVWIVMSLLYLVKRDVKIFCLYERFEIEKYIMDIYIVCLKFMFKISKNWNEYCLYYLYISFLVLYVDDWLYFIILFIEFMGFVFILIIILFSG